MTRRDLLLGLFAAAAAQAKDPVERVNTSRGGLAVKGYDAVAYFTQSRPMKGLPAHSATHDGATYLFASAENRDTFLAAPEKYAPQFGGYCAWAVGHGYTADADPMAWHIDNGKLYLNYNKSVQTMWLKDKAKWIAEGERHWPALHR
ncbi:MAG: YHS domain-containing protein [Bryobacterales bacterium]|nr:YHS domain-containing protein [Bryobacterales bacterium]